jgi:hypothetical protein
VLHNDYGYNGGVFKPKFKFLLIEDHSKIVDNTKLTFVLRPVGPISALISSTNALRSLSDFNNLISKHMVRRGTMKSGTDSLPEVFTALGLHQDCP